MRIRAGEKAAKQVYIFPEPGGYLLRIENINASVEVDLINIPINIPINVVPEFRFSIVAIMMTMIFTTVIFVTKLWIASLRMAWLCKTMYNTPIAGLGHFSNMEI
jgi:hypothetical protein